MTMSKKSLQQLTKKELAKELLLAGLEGLLTGGAGYPREIYLTIQWKNRTYAFGTPPQENAKGQSQNKR